MAERVAFGLPTTRAAVLQVAFTTVLDGKTLYSIAYLSFAILGDLFLLSLSLFFSLSPTYVSDCSLFV